MNQYTLLEANRALSLKLEDIIGVRSHRVGGAWEGGDQQNVAYGHHQPQSQGLFQFLECDPTLQIGYNHSVCSEQVAVTTQGQTQPGNGYISLVGDDVSDTYDLVMTH